MSNTVNKGLNTPATGDLVGSWGTTAVNANMTVLDGILGGVQTISLTNANVSLTIATGSIGTGSLTPGAGPVQSANAVVKFSGTLTGNCVITFPSPGFWIVENNCTVGSFYVQARASGTGNLIGIPPGEPVHIYNDGTDAKFVDMGRVGQFLDLCVSTTPAWMSACTVLPYIPCVGTATYSFTTYPALAAMLGSTFGGNGVSTFGVPDLRGRYRIPLDAGAGRVTSAGSGIDGTTFGASGGSQNQTISTSQMPSHTHTVTDPGHIHNSGSKVILTTNAQGGSGAAVLPNTATAVATAVTGISINASGGTSPLTTMPPGLVFGVTFIKT